MVSDSVGDLIIQLKNAGMAGKDKVVLPYSNLRHAIANKLKEVGYIADAVAEEKHNSAQKNLAITLKYENGHHAINGVKRISKPGRRLYAKVAEIFPVKFGRGHMLLSTPAGIVTDQEARTQRVGGEQLFIIW